MVREEKEQDKLICLNGIPQAEVGGGMSVKNKKELAVESILTGDKKAKFVNQNREEMDEKSVKSNFIIRDNGSVVRGM